MLRRFESYGFAPHATTGQRDELARVLRETGRHIPEVHGSAVGWNRSETAVDLVWEHVYAQADAYTRYMCHPFHICVLDRFLLPENPECITESRRELALGLFGYEVDGPAFRGADGVRRVLAMRAPADADDAEVERFIHALDQRAATTIGVDVSVAGRNTMGLEWFPDGWTHVWEQAFADEDAMRATLDEEASLLEGGPMRDWVDLWYEIEPGSVGEREDAPEVEASTTWERVLMVDTVTVAAADARTYVDGYERLYLPGARSRGLDLVACWHTPADIGEDVVVTTVLDVGTWADWERARNTAVTDPALGEWIAFRRRLMRAGRREFVAATLGVALPRAAR